MKKNGFANSFRILAITLVALAVFTPKKYSQTAMAIAMARAIRRWWMVCICVLADYYDRRFPDS